MLTPVGDYAGEARAIRKLLRAAWRRAGARSQRRSVLDLGAGAGHLLNHLTKDFDAVAVDLSPDMAQQCRQLNPLVQCVVGDMRSIRLGRVFDAVLIHDAIDYMSREEDVLLALRTASAHLETGGLLLVAPTYVRETFIDHQAEHDSLACGDKQLTYLSYIHDPDPDDDCFELVLVVLVDERGVVRVEEDRHVCGLFSFNKWLTMLEDAGFAVQPGADSDHPSTVFVAVKR